MFCEEIDFMNWVLLIYMGDENSLLLFGECHVHNALLKSLLSL